MNRDIEEKKFYSLKYEQVFKKVFGSEEDKEFKLLTALVEECIDSKVENLKLLKTELSTGSTEKKYRGLQLVAESEGKKLKIEINISTSLPARARNVNHFMAFCSENAIVEERFDTDSEFVYISLDYVMDEEEPLFTCYSIHDHRTNECLVENHKIFVLNINRIFKRWVNKSAKIKEKPLLAMFGIEDEENLDAYAQEINNDLVKEVVLRLKKFNQDMNLGHGVSSELGDIYLKNTEIYLAEKREKVIAYHELGLSIEEIMDKTGLSEEEIKDIIK